MGRTSDSRQRLMDAAHELIWGYSYGSVTIEAICERAKVKKGSFYYFFDSKSDLAVAAINSWWEERKALVAHLFRPEVPPLERITAYIDFVAQDQLEAYENHGQLLGCPIFTLGSEICTRDEPVRSLVREILYFGARCFEETIREAQSLGQAEPGDAAQRGRMLWAFYEGSLTRARIENNPEVIRTLSADALAIALGRSLAPVEFAA